MKKLIVIALVVMTGYMHGSERRPRNEKKRQVKFAPSNIVDQAALQKDCQTLNTNQDSLDERVLHLEVANHDQHRLNHHYTNQMVALQRKNTSLENRLFYIQIFGMAAFGCWLWCSQVSSSVES